MRDRSAYYAARYQARKAAAGRTCTDCRKPLAPTGAGHVRCHSCAALVSPGVHAAISAAIAARRKAA